MSWDITFCSNMKCENLKCERNQNIHDFKLNNIYQIDEEKGWKRMLKLMEMLKREGIKFEWNIFTNSRQMCNYEEVHLCVSDFINCKYFKKGE